MRPADERTEQADEGPNKSDHIIFVLVNGPLLCPAWYRGEQKQPERYSCGYREDLKNFLECRWTP